MYNEFKDNYSSRHDPTSGDKQSEMFVTECLLPEMLDETVTGTKEVPVRIDEDKRLWFWDEEGKMEMYFSFKGENSQEFVPAVANEAIAKAVECHLAWHPSWKKGGVSFLKNGKVKIFPGDEVLVLRCVGSLPTMGETISEEAALIPILLKVLGPTPQVVYPGRG